VAERIRRPGLVVAQTGEGNVAGEQIRLLVIEDVPQVASHIRSLLNAQTQIKVLDVVTSGDQAVGAVTELKPDVVIVDALLQGRTSGSKVAEGIRGAEPSAAVIMLTVPQNPVQENPERGIDAVLKMPFTGFDLTTLIRKTHEEYSVESARVGSLMVALFSPKGGVGRTTLAYNLAAALGREHRVCLVDGSLQFSDLRGLLRVPAVAPSIINLPTDRIRESDLVDVLWKDPSGVDILLAPPRVEMAEMITARDIEKALSMIRRTYEFVVVDTRAALSDDVLVFLDTADLILQVATYDGMAIRGLAMAGETFGAIGYSDEKIATVLNRADASGGFSREDLEATLGRQVEFEVVSDGRLVLAANNEGVPFVLSSPEAPISQGINRIASVLTEIQMARMPVLAGRH
jgi:pilus assembly protein CpaE